MHDDLHHGLEDACGAVQGGELWHAGVKRCGMQVGDGDVCGARAAFDEGVKKVWRTRVCFGSAINPEWR
eukprot:365083-Chlamydomonas_euryale.AAC.40